MSEADPALDPSDPYARIEQTFPVLPQAFVDTIAHHGTEARYEDGALLFERGERSVDFFVVREGAVEIFDLDESGQVEVLHRHGVNQFTGELDLFNDRRILVSGRARGETRVIRVAHEAFRSMIASEPELGETIMRAFILRRVGLLNHGQGGVTLVGPRAVAIRCASSASSRATATRCACSTATATPMRKSCWPASGSAPSSCPS